MIAQAWAFLLGCTGDPRDPGPLATADMASSLRMLTSAWAVESNQEGAALGDAVSSAGDVNGDGYADVVVSSTLFDHGQTDEGKVMVFHGSPLGLSPVPDWTMEPNEANTHFGSGVACAGDVNGDGYDDLIVGAEAASAGEFKEGKAFLFLGSATGLESTPAWTAESNEVEAHFGRAVSSAGDVNGDGFDDVVVGASDWDDSHTDEGRVYLYLGSSAGLAATESWTWDSDQTSAWAGEHLAAAGDVDGDGYGDVLVGANGYGDGGAVFLFSGSATGLRPKPAWTVEEGTPFASLGQVTGGDVNGDGYDDVVVGASGNISFGPVQGYASLYLGSSVGLDTTAAWTRESDQWNDSFGSGVAIVGDVNHDGYGDLVVGSVLHDSGSVSEGRIELYLGSGAGLDDASWRVDGNQDFANMGWSQARAGDVNGDGYDDVVVGLKNFDYPDINEGVAFLYEGGCPAGAHLDFADSDGDAVDDACDLCPGFDDVADSDEDQVPDGCDICPAVPNQRQTDADADGVGDACVPLILTLQSLSIAGGVAADVEHARPGENVMVYLVNGAAEVGPCPPGRGGFCLDIGEADGTSWVIVAGPDGHGSLAEPLPAGFVDGAVVTIQAAASRKNGGVKSDAIETVVTP